MSKNFEIRKLKLETRSTRIAKTPVDDTQKVSFNFKHLCTSHAKFCYSSCEKEYFQKLLSRLKDVSTWTAKELRTDHSKTLRSHQINFDSWGITERGFNLGEDIGDDAWQISISANAYGRIHGYFIANIFYIIWLDPEHKLYPVN